MKKKVLISTGGSGGHVIPAITIYDHLKSRYETLISTDIRGLKYIDKENYKSIIIDTPKLNNLFFFLLNLRLFLLILKYLLLMNLHNLKMVMSFLLWEIVLYSLQDVLMLEKLLDLLRQLALI